MYDTSILCVAEGVCVSLWDLCIGEGYVCQSTFSGGLWLACGCIYVRLVCVSPLCMYCIFLCDMANNVNIICHVT